MLYKILRAAQKEKRRKAEKRPLTYAVRNVNILSWIEEKDLASYFKKWPRRPEEIQEGKRCPLLSPQLLKPTPQPSVVYVEGT